jgi:hypothetical protein
MPPKKPVEPQGKAAESDLLLQYGPSNNIISWRDRIEDESVELYGMTGTFFSTNRPYHISYPVERDFHPFPEMLSDSESDSDNDGDNAVVPVTSPVGDGEAEAGPPVPEVDKATKALIAKMRENTFEARRKKMELQELNLTKLWPYVTNQMSSASLWSTRISRIRRGQGLQRRESTVGFHPEGPPQTTIRPGALLGTSARPLGITLYVRYLILKTTWNHG